MVGGSVGIMTIGGFFLFLFIYVCSGMRYALSRGDGGAARFLLVTCFRRSTFHHEHIRSCPREKDDDKGPDFEGMRSWASGCAGDVGPKRRFRV